MQIFNAKLSSTGFSITYSTANYSNAVDLGGPAINSTKDYMLFTAYPVTGNKIKLAQLISGTWQVLGDLASPVNGSGGCHDDNPFLIGNAASGTVYWQSRRSDLAGTSCRSDQLQRYYYATVTNGTLSGAQLVPGLSSSTSNDYEASFSEDKTKAYWIRADTAPAIFAIMTADWNGSAYSAVRPVISINNTTPPFDDKIVDIGEPNVVELPEGYLMYFRCVVALATSGGQPAQRQLRFCVSKKTK